MIGCTCIQYLYEREGERDLIDCMVFNAMFNSILSISKNVFKGFLLHRC